MPFKDPERQRAYGRAWMKRNPQKAREAMRRWRQKHPEAHAAQSRAYYARDPKRAQRIIDASPNRRAVRRAADHRRRASELGAGSFSAAQWLALVQTYGGRCGYCGETRPLQAEHRIPLSRGGSNTIDNIIPACARCNARKGQLTEVEYRARLASERLDNLNFE